MPCVFENFRVHQFVGKRVSKNIRLKYIRLILVKQNIIQIELTKPYSNRITKQIRTLKHKRNLNLYKLATQKPFCF